MLEFPALSAVPFLCCSFCSPFCGSFHLSGVRKPSSAQLSRIFSEKLATTISLRIAWDLRNILELVDNRFDNRSFAQQELVRQMHEPVFHVFAQSCDELESVFKEQVAQESRNVAAICEQLPAQSFDHLRNRNPIIDVAW